MTEAGTDILKQTARALTGSAQATVMDMAGGGNSRVYKVIADGRTYALKRYPVIENDTRDRLGTERLALQFFAQQGIGCVPKWIAASPPFALMEWIDGQVVTAPAARDIDEAADFLSRIFKASKEAPSAMPLASEACLSGAEIVRQLEARLARLQTIDDASLQKFLSDKFLPAMQERTQKARGANFDVLLPENQRRLIPADFGFHNALHADGKPLVFIDFEYFGWDDPVKVLSDFLLHPATPVSEAFGKQFLARLLPLLPAAEPRFQAFYPLFGLRWTLILLNEFLPERWQARAFARGENDAQAARQRQLEKAQAMLERSETATI